MTLFRRIRNWLFFSVGRVACARLLPTAESHRRALTQPALRRLNESVHRSRVEFAPPPRRGGYHPPANHAPQLKRTVGATCGRPRALREAPLHPNYHSCACAGHPAFFKFGMRGSSRTPTPTNAARQNRIRRGDSRIARIPRADLYRRLFDRIVNSNACC